MCGSHQTFCPAIPTGCHSAVVVPLQCASRCVGCRRLRPCRGVVSAVGTRGTCARSVRCFAHRSCCVAGWGLPLFALPGAAAGGTRRSGGGGAGGKRARQRAGSRCASGARSACRFPMHELGGRRSLLTERSRRGQRAAAGRSRRGARGAQRKKLAPPRDTAFTAVFTCILGFHSLSLRVSSDS